ncbi:MAG: tRNA (adenosine(37)-N6)-dimethylallyltransferase MiaA [Ignavibacteria bacterium]|nr:tRNA (adenosine(37)-N6)-dimethylallyltransferase MiaA [Ignavibacteria bacterium]
MERRVLAIVGPTASGKSKLAIKIAQRLKTEIISADSRQIFKELTIGTAKPDEEDLKKIKHHFINHISLNEQYDVGKFVKEAEKIINELHSLNKIPIVVGGSGLYINSLLYGIFEGPSADEEIRQSLEKELREKGLESLCQKLMEFDPETCAKIDKNNPRRIIRALEVYYLTGKPISQIQREKHKTPEFETLIFGLKWERQKLYERINRRVDQMIKAGLIDEVQNILKKFGGDVNVALQTVGYKEVIEFLNEEISYDDMIELIKRNTRRYAKRQLTWFRKDKNIQWIEIQSEDEFEEIAERIINKIVEGKNERQN